MIDFRRRHPAIHRSRFFDGKVNERGLPDVSWHGCQLLRPGWDDPNARALAFTLAGFGTGGRHQRHVQHGRPRAGLRGPGRAGTAVAPGRGHGATVAARHRRAGAGRTDRRPTDARRGAERRRFAFAMTCVSGRMAESPISRPRSPPAAVLCRRREFTFHLITSTLENETRLGRVLFHPEVSAYEHRTDRLRRALPTDGCRDPETAPLGTAPAASGGHARTARPDRPDRAAGAWPRLGNARPVALPRRVLAARRDGGHRLRAGPGHRGRRRPLGRTFCGNFPSRSASP